MNRKGILLINYIGVLIFFQDDVELYQKGIELVAKKMKVKGKAEIELVFYVGLLELF